ncbi:MAG: MbnP family copper-binding protein [Polyangiales bacterium]
MLALGSACGSDDSKSAEPDDTAATDAGSPGAPTGSAADAGASNGPPDTKDGKKLHTVRFDMRAGDTAFGCGKPAALGTTATMAEPTDVRFYVHDVALVRASGERVPLELHQDGMWQRENVALLDFADDTGKCVTGNPELRTLVQGYAPAHDDYRSLSFKLGVPADKNHLDGANAPAPYNASGMWWSWSGGYKYVRLDLTSAAQPVWYFHAGAASCQGLTNTGFTCAARQLADVTLDDYDADKSLVVFDVAKFYAGVDVATIRTTDTAGCMGSKDDPDCKPLYNALGVVPFDDAAQRPQQTTFRLTTGPSLAPNTDVAAKRSPLDPAMWPDPSFTRPASLNVDNVSRAGEARSHKVGDKRHGASCNRCHQEHGPGVGQFSAAGTVFDQEGKPAQNVKVEIIAGTADRVNHTFTNVTSYATLDVDANGNFFTTQALPYDREKLTARVLGADGAPLVTMMSTKQTGACNTCHTAGFRIELPSLPATH